MFPETWNLSNTEYILVGLLGFLLFITVYYWDKLASLRLSTQAERDKLIAEHTSELEDLIAEYTSQIENAEQSFQSKLLMARQQYLEKAQQFEAAQEAFKQAMNKYTDCSRLDLERWFQELERTMYKNEIEVEVKFIYPLLRYLGYLNNEIEIRTPVTIQVGREHHTVEADWMVRKHVHGIAGAKPVLVVEAKAPSQSLDSSVQAQARSYAFGLNVDTYMIVNGINLCLFRRGVTHDALVLECSIRDIAKQWPQIEQLIGAQALTSSVAIPLSERLALPKVSDAVSQDNLTMVRCFPVQERVRVYGYVERQISEGKQGVIVFPAQANITNIVRELQNNFFPNRNIGVMTNKMEYADAVRILGLFSSRRIDILLTNNTTVNPTSPDTSVMIVNDADVYPLEHLQKLREWTYKHTHRTYFAMIANVTDDEAFKLVEAVLISS
jgi:hypothetical protein